ncbi:YihY/virulence factor BrkB family protein [Euzebyella marina]|uniref:YihY/virulence factor BrkB family protein n=1 Tax=Euzebyella marina TaxID=1761453 RepID=A0A3G2L5M1_9FLAO|nr:YihY/virulence factor BrkB family protein [Euzebyella marina]AYN67562.1 YihY/virulence factor BrkB family protein [Euzebyella marina]
MVKENSTFEVKHIPSLLKETYIAWNNDNPFRLSAVVAYYAILSLPALLVIIVNLVGTFTSPESIQDILTSEFSEALGKDSAEAIQVMLDETENKKRNLISTIIGLGTLIFGATGMFYQLQISLNDIWQVEPDPKAKWWKLVFDRARSFAFILVIGFLLLISFVATAALSALNDYIKSSFPDMVLTLAQLFDILFSLGIISLLFALMFKFLPDAKVEWKTVWIGAFITSILFLLGKLILGYYFGQANPGSTYGAAGTIVLILLWVSYSCLILLFGAKFTFVYANRYGQGIRPMPLARKKA